MSAEGSSLLDDWSPEEKIAASLKDAKRAAAEADALLATQHCHGAVIEQRWNAKKGCRMYGLSDNRAGDSRWATWGGREAWFHSQDVAAYFAVRHWEMRDSQRQSVSGVITRRMVEARLGECDHEYA